MHILLPTNAGTLETYHLKGITRSTKRIGKPKSRIAYAAAHVVANPFPDIDISSGCAIDWEATLEYRRYLWSLGLSVAEAMDTAQRGMGLDFSSTKELISLSIKEAKACDGDIACGAGTDQISSFANPTLKDVQRAYEEQCEFIESQGGRIILMASRALARVANSPEDYAEVYDAILSSVQQPVILHWLGDMFDPMLQGYWGHTEIAGAMNVCLDLIRRNADKVQGIKISLLNASLEVEMRRRLPGHVRMFTGDDFNYPELIHGDEQGHSDALLGIFDAIAPIASEALEALDCGDSDKFMSILHPTVPLSRHIFHSPTRFYKTGVVFLAYLNAHQSHYRMIGGMESMRSVLHLSELFRLADEASLFRDPEIALGRMQRMLATVGVV